MSQPSTPFDGTTVNPWTSSMEQPQHFTPDTLDDLLNSSGSDHPAFSSESDVFSDLNFCFNNEAFSQIDSSIPSAISTPDFTAYSFGQSIQAYPTPCPDSPYPYPLDIQHSIQSNANTITNPSSYAQCRPPCNGNANIAYLNSSQQPSKYARRRSLSHGDVDRIAITNAIPNPTFVRLQAPRAPSATPEERRRIGPNTQHARSASQGLGQRGRPMKVVTTPYGMHGNPVVGGMMSTCIGTPLDMEGNGFQMGLTMRGHEIGNTGVAMQYDGPHVQHMKHPQALLRSRQILEIGAMAVRKQSPSNVDPKLEQDPTTTNQECLMKNLEELERYLRQGEGGNENALQGCGMIRAALIEGIERQKQQDSEKRELADQLDTPSTVLSERDCNLFDHLNEDNKLMALLIMENVRNMPNSDHE